MLAPLRDYLEAAGVSLIIFSLPLFIRRIVFSLILNYLKPRYNKFTNFMAVKVVEGEACR